MFYAWQIYTMKKFFCYLNNFASYYTPRSVYKSRLNEILTAADNNKDIAQRVNYYCRLDSCSKLPSDAGVSVRQFHFPYISKHRFALYFFDLYRAVKFFPGDLRFDYLFGDIIHEPSIPTFVKSRPITSGATNSVIMKWDSFRHFNFINDDTPFLDKKPTCVMRNLWANDKRKLFLNKFTANPIVDCGVTRPPIEHPEWNTGYLSMRQQLQHRFIMCIEGNDVATNLKWVMSSNSLAVMPRPEYETWYMEGRLIPGVHYVEVAKDYSDLLEKIDYYNNHIDEAQQIIEQQHTWVAQFLNPEIELITEVATANKYFSSVL